MPPTVKITKEDIVHTAVNIARESGSNAINARSIAKVLNCSTQPIFSNFRTMDELRGAVIRAAEEKYKVYCKNEIDGGKYPIYKATGMAYIRFAKEETELFKLLFMRDRNSEAIKEDHKASVQLFKLIQHNTGLSEDAAKLFHLEMWVYVHGIATMIATNYLSFDTTLISRMLTDSYEGLKKHYTDKR